VWELDWPAKSINNPSPFTQTKNSTSTVVVEIINNEGKSIGKQTVKSPYGFESRSAVITPLWQWEGDVVFTAVNANLITDKLTIKITSIDGVAAENASKQKNISVMPLTEWDSLLKTLPSTRRNIELAQQRQREQELAAIRQKEQEAAAAAAKAQYDQGNKNYNAGNYAQAILNFTEAIRLDSKYATATTFYNRGMAYYYTSNYYPAINDYTEAIRLNPNDAASYNNRGNVYYYYLDNYYQAIADYTEAIRLDSKYATATTYYNRGIAYHNINNFNQAIADFTQVIRLTPNNSTAYFYRGYAYGEFGSYDQAIADYTQAIRLNPNDASAYNNRGWAYEKKGNKLDWFYAYDNYIKAKADFDAALRLDPSNALYIRNANRIRDILNKGP